MVRKSLNLELAILALSLWHLTKVFSRGATAFISLGLQSEVTVLRHHVSPRGTTFLRPIRANAIPSGLAIRACDIPGVKPRAIKCRRSATKDLMYLSFWL